MSRSAQPTLCRVEGKQKESLYQGWLGTSIVIKKVAEEILVKEFVQGSKPT